MSMAVYTQEQLDLARQLGAATLHEAAGRVGALPSAIKPVTSAMKLCGPAFTVHCPAFSNLQIHQSLYRASPGDILVVHVSGGTEAGYWGDILNEAAMAQRLGGIVIDGGVRDTEGLSTSAFPVFSNGICIFGTGKDRDAVAWMQKPVRMGKIVISSGDLVIGDRDGVVVLRQDSVKNVLAAGVARAADESHKIDKIRAGGRTIDLYGFGGGNF